MSQKHLKELLLEDQEPFMLKNYISDRRFQLKRQSPKTHLLVKKRRSNSVNFPTNLCKKACFFSFSESPDARKSPLFEFASPSLSSPCYRSKPPNKIFLQIPARTAALLLEASLRIQKPSSDSNTKAPQTKNNGLGLFGSILKRLTNRNRNRKREREIVGDGVNVSVKDILDRDSSVPRRKESQQIHNHDTTNTNTASASAYEISCSGQIGFSFSPSSCSCNGSHKDKSLYLDLDTSCSSQWEDIKPDFTSKIIDLATSDKYLCESPFHFILQRSPSSGRRTPDFSSPAESPKHYQTREKENDDVDSSSKLERENEEEEEEKEQCSPVSVLDPPFEDDDDGHVDDRYECSYAIVQKVKQQLLHKLRRFEELAGLDPIELEKRMAEQENDEYDHDYTYHNVEEDECDLNIENELVHQILKSNFRRISKDMNKLVCDLIAEEKNKGNGNDREETGKRVCKRLELWKEVESNTIDMMVSSDFEKQVDWLKRNEDEVKEIGLEIECCILDNLVDELAEELVCC